MRSSDAIKLLDCTRASLSLYVKQGKIKVVQLDNGRYFRTLRYAIYTVIKHTDY